MTSGRWRGAAGWWPLMILAVLVAAYALAALAVPGVRPPLLQQLVARAPLALVAHLGGGALALVIGALQVHTRLRNQRPGLHRRLGTAYVAAVAASGSAGLVLALQAQGGLAARLGFGMLALCWLVATGIAWRRIRREDEDGHRDWMIRSYALTLAAVSLRIYLPASLATGLPFEQVYPAIAWMCWVPNLLAAEWLVLPWVRRPARPAGTPA